MTHILVRNTDDMRYFALPASAGEQQTRFYAPDGRSAGTAVPLGQGSVRYFDERGRSLRTSTTTGNATQFYDSAGRRSGSTVGPGPLNEPRR